jgi:4-carboxymuconolactone decarboxylase
MSRLPPADPAKDANLESVYEEIRQTRGFVSNALRAIGHAPEGLKHLARLGAYTKYETDLPERMREFSILCAGRKVPYAFHHHSALARQAGIPQAAIDDVGADRVPASLPPNEQAVARFVFELFSPGSVSDATMKEMAKHYTPRQITDVALSATYYSALGTMILAFKVAVETPEVLKTERDWQKSKIDAGS